MSQSTRSRAEDREEMAGSLSPLLVGRLAALLWVGGGFLTLLYLAVPHPPMRDALVVALISLTGVGIGIACWFLPWNRWPRPASLVLVPLALALIAAGNYYGSVDPYTFGVLFIVVFAWIGIGHRRWTASVFGPLGLVAYLAPILAGARGSAAASSVILTIPIAVLVGEGLAWIADRERRSQFRAHALARLASQLGEHLAEEDIFQTLVEEGQKVLATEHAVIYRLDPEDRTIRAVYTTGVGGPFRRLLEGLVGSRIPSQPLIDMLERSEPVVVEDTSQPHLEQPEAVEIFGIKSYLAVPVLAEGRLVGILSCGETSKPRSYDREDVDLATAVASQASIAIRNALLYQETLEASRRDPLTNLENRRAFHERLAEEVERARRHGRALSLVYFDLDGLKSVNDSHGHQAGDCVLLDISELFLGALRQADGAYRIGGDEFALILPETPRAGATILAERIRHEIDRSRLGGEADAHLTVSVGVASYPEHGMDPDELSARADACMYEVKASGGDAVCVASVDVEPSPSLRFGVDVRRVLSEDLLTAMYQPIVDLESGCLLGYDGFAEVGQQHGTFPVATLRRAASELGLVDLLDRRSREVVLANAAGLPHETKLFVSVSTISLLSPGMDPATLEEIVAEAGLSPERIILTLPPDPGPEWRAVVSALGRYTDRGFGAALAEVGPRTDPNLVSRIPADHMKVDWAYLRGTPEDQRQASVEAIRRLLEQVRGARIADRIQKHSELAAACELGFTAAQGRLIGQPSPRFEEPSLPDEKTGSETGESPNGGFRLA